MIGNLLRLLSRRGEHSRSLKNVAGAWFRQSLGGARWFSMGFFHLSPSPSLSVPPLMLDLCLHIGQNVYTGNQVPLNKGDNNV